MRAIPSPVLATPLKLSTGIVRTSAWSNQTEAPACFVEKRMPAFRSPHFRKCTAFKPSENSALILSFLATHGKRKRDDRASLSDTTIQHPRRHDAESNTTVVHTRIQPSQGSVTRATAMITILDLSLHPLKHLQGTPFPFLHTDSPDAPRIASYHDPPQHDPHGTQGPHFPSKAPPPPFPPRKSSRIPQPSRRFVFDSPIPPSMSSPPPLHPMNQSAL